MTDFQSIPLNRLVHSKANVRRTARDTGIEALMASIEAHGLRQNLNVRPTTGSRFEVVAGGRRLEALRRLKKAGRIEPQTQIWCAVLAEGEDPVEISLAENAVREPMHPDDECTAFQTLVSQGQSIETVAARFGVTPAVVRQRLKLAAVSPKLRKLFRNGEIDLAQMMALALVDDHAQQEQVWNDLPDWNNDPDYIRSMLTQDGIPANHRLALCVGTEAYEAAGGTVLRDLFYEDVQPILTDAELLGSLATRKMEEEAAHVQAEGWQWVKVEIRPDYTTAYGRLYPHDGEDDANPTYSAEDYARAGARVILNHRGQVEIERGLIEREAQQKVSLADAKNQDASIPAYSAPVIEDLTAHRTAALRLELSNNAAVALAATVHAMALGLMYPGAYDTASCLGISMRSERVADIVADRSESPAHDALDAAQAEWKALLPSRAADLWDWCLGQEQGRLLDLLAYLAGLSVNAIRRKGDSPNSKSLRASDQLAEALALDMHMHWQPKADGFFARLPKALMAHLLTEADLPQTASVLPRLKKVEAAQRTTTALTARGWLPAPMLPCPAAADDADDQHQEEDEHERHDDDDQQVAA